MSTDALLLSRDCLLRPHQVNAARVLRTSELLRLLQDTSVAHTEQLGLTKEKTLEKGLLWVIARQHVRISRMPVYDEEIRIVTWPDKMQHLFFPRRHQILSRDSCLVEAEALWLLMSEQDRRVIFPAEYELSLPERPDVPSFPDLLPVRPPAGAAVVKEFLYTPRFSQTDLNGHINNACYFDLIDDMLPAGYLLTHAPSDISSEYGAEIRPGQTIRIRCLKSENAPDLFWFEGIPENSETSRPSFRVRMQFQE